jgi:hydroxymethylpyrimidine/phosphomethylpyrimidine kinase
MNSQYSSSVLIIAGNDPTGGAGITADIESVISQGCFAFPVISCVTVQDTCDVTSINPLDSELVLQQARTVLEDLSVNAIKIGLLGSEENVEAVHEAVDRRSPPKASSRR